MLDPPSTPKPQRTANQLLTPAPTEERHKRQKEGLFLTPPPEDQSRSPSPCPTADSVDSLERLGIPRLVRQATRPNFPWCRDEERSEVADAMPFFHPPGFATDDAGAWPHKGGEGASPDCESSPKEVENHVASTALATAPSETVLQSSDTLQMVLVNTDRTECDGTLHLDLTKDLRRQREDSEEIQFVGELHSSGTVDRPRPQQRRRLQPLGSPELREISPDYQPRPQAQHSRQNNNKEGGGRCRACGCACSEVGGRGRGGGSTTLTNGQRANILALLLGVYGNRRETLFEQIAKRRPELQMADVAQLIGARREDYDRVRFAARWMQETLPAMMRQGRL